MVLHIPTLILTVLRIILKVMEISNKVALNLRVILYKMDKQTLLMYQILLQLNKLLQLIVYLQLILIHLQLTLLIM